MELEVFKLLMTKDPATRQLVEDVAQCMLIRKAADSGKLTTSELLDLARSDLLNQVPTG